MELRLGQLLIETGVLTATQVERILCEQQRSGEPFGLLCERLYQIEPETIEKAWAMQYASLSPTVDLEREQFDPEAMALVSRRQAWQFRVLPLRFDDGELMIATTQAHLRRALRFAVAVMGVPVYLVLASPEALGQALCRHYPLPGMTPRSINENDLASLLRTR